MMNLSRNHKRRVLLVSFETLKNATNEDGSLLWQWSDRNPEPFRPELELPHSLGMRPVLCLRAQTARHG